VYPNTNQFSISAQSQALPSETDRQSLCQSHPFNIRIKSNIRSLGLHDKEGQLGAAGQTALSLDLKAR